MIKWINDLSSNYRWTRMHCKIVGFYSHYLTNTLSKALKQDDRPLIDLRNLILTGRLGYDEIKQTKAFSHTLAAVNNSNTPCSVWKCFLKSIVCIFISMEHKRREFSFKELFDEAKKISKEWCNMKFRGEIVVWMVEIVPNGSMPISVLILACK